MNQPLDANAPTRAAGIAYLSAGRILLLMRSPDSYNGNCWGFPAGREEQGETPEATASRESLEETGHIPGALSLVSDDGVFALFLCRDPQFVPVLNDEHVGYVWAPLDTLPQPLHPAVLAQLGMAQAASAGVAMDESARTVDTNGWTEIKDNPLSVVGVYPYKGAQIPGAPDPDATYMVYRPAEELSAPDCIASFRLLPWIDNHTMLGDEESGLTPAERKGVQGVVGEDLYFKDGTLYGNLKVFSQSLATLIDAGKRELSCGYRCRYEHSPGVTADGRAYDYIQREMRGNHLALVESGRMGSAVAVLDSADLDLNQPPKEPLMAEENKAEGGSGVTLEAALETFKTVMPVIKQIQDHLASLAAPPAAEAKVDLDGTAPVIDAGVANPDDDKEDKPVAKAADAEVDAKKDEEKKADAMDAAPSFKSIVAQISRRDSLASKLSAHVGVFDHSDMTEAEVAAYGIKKLGLSADKGAESAVLSGFLAGRADPAKAVVAKTTSAMDASGDNFVTRHLKKGA